MASLLTSPIDLVKVRLQAEGKLAGRYNTGNKTSLNNSPVDTHHDVE